MGQVEFAEIPSCDDLYCKTYFSSGPDWAVIGGSEEGYSQMARKTTGGEPLVVWNFPIDINFRSTNAYGWPQLVIAVQGFDWGGRDVIRGYGCTFIPPASGTYEQYVRLFTPKSVSGFQSFMGIYQGQRPEFVDKKLPAQGVGREVTHTKSEGVVKVRFDVITRHMQTFGYRTS